MKLILAVVRPFKVAEIVEALSRDPAFPGMTVLPCRGFGREKSAPHRRSPAEELRDFVDREALLVATPDSHAAEVARRIGAIAHTGRPGDGKVFTIPLDAALRIATGEAGDGALE